MQGPVPPSSGRRGGDSASSGGPGGEGLKDWQKNTWFGPVPPNSNSTPFEEPETAPELLEARSSNVSNHTGSFWTDQGQTGYQYPKGEAESSDSSKRTRNARKRERTISLRAVVVFLGLLTAAALVVWFGVFRIQEIRVIGNRDISASDIIRFSGIRKGASILQLSEEDTERRMISSARTAASEQGNYNYYRLQFRYLEKELPGTVILSVHEREACCFVTWCGIMYVMDKSGMVLYETEDPGMPGQVELVEIKGMDIRSGAHVGQTMVLSSAAQAIAFKDLFLEMKVLGCTSQIQEVDLSNPDSILLLTRDRFTVSLGSSESLHAKLRSMMLVRRKLEEMGQSGGSINVSNPETPSYSPSAPQ